LRILLDTHLFLWMIQDARRVPPVLKAKLDDLENEVVFSAVLAWEIAVKRAKGKLHFSEQPTVAAKRIGLLPLPITADHCEFAADLKSHHSDPFDRLLVAQAQMEGLVMATLDPVMKQYGIPLLQFR
jgi:PIN domain nuclease of toxin-antitoxin system